MLFLFKQFGGFIIIFLIFLSYKCVNVYVYVFVCMFGGFCLGFLSSYFLRFVFIAIESEISFFFVIILPYHYYHLLCFFLRNTNQCCHGNNSNNIYFLKVMPHKIIASSLPFLFTFYFMLMVLWKHKIMLEMAM